MIRFAGPRDTAAIRALWEACFPDEGGFNDYFFAHHFALSNTLLSVEEGALCAMVQMLPYRLVTGGGEVEITYIYGACTDPAHRRQGHMARLLARSFALDRQAGRAASALIPAEPWLFGFYEPFGYAPFFHVDRREICRQGSGVLPRRRSRACSRPSAGNGLPSRPAGRGARLAVSNGMKKGRMRPLDI